MILCACFNFLNRSLSSISQRTAVQKLLDFVRHSLYTSYTSYVHTPYIVDSTRDRSKAVVVLHQACKDEFCGKFRSHTLTAEFFFSFFFHNCCKSLPRGTQYSLVLVPNMALYTQFRQVAESYMWFEMAEGPLAPYQYIITFKFDLKMWRNFPLPQKNVARFTRKLPTTRNCQVRGFMKNVAKFTQNFKFVATFTRIKKNVAKFTRKNAHH